MNIVDLAVATAVNGLSTVAISGVVSIVVFVVGTWLTARITGGVQHGYDKKLEDHRKQVEADLERLRAAIRAGDEKVAALRNGALANMTARHATLGEKRIEAAETLWRAVIEQSKLKAASKITEVIKMDVALERAERQDVEGQKMRDFAGILVDVYKFEDNKDRQEADRARPFLSPLAWAKFAAYRHVLSFAVAQLAVMKAGLGKKVLADPEPMIEMVKATLPHQANYLDKYGAAGLAGLVDELENAVFDEIVRSLNDQDLDAASVKQAATILALSDQAALPKPPIEIPAAIRSE